MIIRLEDTKKTEILGNFLSDLTEGDGLIRGVHYGIEVGFHSILVLPLRRREECVVCGEQIAEGDGAELRLLTREEKRKRMAGKHVSFHYSHFERSETDL